MGDVGVVRVTISGRMGQAKWETIGWAGGK